MERFDTSHLDKIAFKAINQNGYGDDIDRYIYAQSGEGLGSFFGKVVKISEDCYTFVFSCCSTIQYFTEVPISLLYHMQ